MKAGNICRYLQEAFARKRAAHAYIVVGEKQQLPDILKQCAAVCMCPSHSGVDGCEICNKVYLGIHQDVLFFPKDRERGRLTVADMLSLVDETYKRPIDSGENRVFLVDASSSVTGVAAESWQNKLLKTLEEPMENVYIFIGVTDSETLLSTVRSRCQILKQEMLTPFEVCKRLVERGYEKRAAEVAASVSADVDAAESILANPAVMRAFQNALDMSQNMTSTKNALQFVSPVLAERETAQWFLAFWTVLLRESIVYRLADELRLLPSFEEEMKKICANYSLQAAEVCIEKINAAKNRLDDNGNVTVVLDNLVNSVLEVKYRCRI